MARTGVRRELGAHRPGRAMTVHGEPGDRTVLLWHGVGPDERTVLAPLADALASTGLHVLVPDWNSGAPDGGRADLAASLDSAAADATEAGIVLVGWSLGGTAAVATAFATRPGGPRISAVVGLAADPLAHDRLSGVPLPEVVRQRRQRCPVRLVHGRQDVVVPLERCTAFAGSFDAGVTAIEVDTDHAGIVGTAWDPLQYRCVPSDGPCARTGLRAAVDAVQAVLGVDQDR